jgi:Na+-driven multidrug efflux pump
VLDLTAIGVNYLLNPVLIYGGTAVAVLGADGDPVPVGAGLADGIARTFGIEGRGLAGAALATALSRAVTSLVGLAILRFGFEMSLLGSLRPKLSCVADIARLSAPVSLSIGIYAAVYLSIFSLVMAPFPTEVKAGLGIGFQVFEGLSFPCYLGVAIAGASLVGQRLGARDPEGAREVVRATRTIGRAVGVGMTVAFLFASRLVVPWFTRDPGVADATLTYVSVLAFSQYWVSVETVNEKVLLGAGHTRPILWIAGVGNALRVPLAWLLASVLGLGAIGVWWAINTTTYLKAGLFWTAVERGGWVTHLADRERRLADRPERTPVRR